MAKYSNIKKPAFFIPFMDYAQSIGSVVYQDNELNDIHLLNPAKTHKITPDEGWWETGEIRYDINFNSSISYQTISDSDGYIYIFILGHNLNTADCSIEIRLEEILDPNLSISAGTIEREKIVNDLGDNSAPEYNGFSIIKAKYNISNVSGIRIIIKGHSVASNNEIKIGSISLCSKWNPPHNPDLSLKMSRQFDGVHTTRTKGGATLSDTSYTRGGTLWGDSHAWDLIDTDSDYAESFSRTLGRRIWNMNFSYLTPTNLMPEFESLDYYETEYNDNLDKSIQTSQSFFARVLNRVQGSHLPFIFLPNDTDPNYNPDQWAICRFDQNDFSITQAAPELYSLSMKLTESW